MRIRLDWRGDEVRQRVEAAARLGIDDTMAACVLEAKNNHGWKNRTGTAERSIRAEPARMEGTRVVGRWGSFDVRYFIYLELGTRFITADHTLRRAADRHYPSLARRIQQHLR